MSKIVLNETSLLKGDFLEILKEKDMLKPYEHFTGLKAGKYKTFRGLTYNKDQYDCNIYIQEIVLEVHYNRTTNNITYVFEVNNVGVPV